MRREHAAGLARSVGREIEHRQISGELLLPIPELVREIGRLQPVALPDGKVGILNGQVGQVGGLAVDERPVAKAEFAEEDPVGPSVADDVMQRQK